MIIGVPREIKDNENRVSITPENVCQLSILGHEILIQKEAGTGSGFSDEEYINSGATIIDNPRTIFDRSEMIIKVKEPLEEEYNLFHENQIVFTYFHFASNAKLLEAMIKNKVIAIAYETIRDKNGYLPLLIPMSEIAGKLSAQIAAYLITKPFGGDGILMGGATGTMPAKILIIGAGVAGTNAAKIAAGMGGQVLLIDNNVDRLRYLSDVLLKNITLLKSSRKIIQSLAKEVDIIIGSVLIPGEKAPKIILEQDIKMMKKNSVFIDISIDQGGCSETSIPTTHTSPIYIKYDVIHYCVTNMPAIVPRTSTNALSNATIPYILHIASKGINNIKEQSSPVRSGLCLFNGEVIDKKLLKFINNIL